MQKTVSKMRLTLLAAYFWWAKYFANVYMKKWSMAVAVRTHIGR